VGQEFPQAGTTHSVARIRRLGVTGAAGFIGSHLVKRMLDEDVTVVAVDDLSYGFLANLRHCFGHPGFQFEVLDCTRTAELEVAFRGCDTIVHLAGRKIPRYGDASEMLRRNIAGIESVCSVALDAEALLLLASTSDVYGHGRPPFAENGPLVLGPPTSRRWGYAVSKLYGEHLALALAAEQGLRVTILRLFGSYGPHNHPSWWGGPQAAFIEALLDGLPMEIHGDGMQIRSFTYVTDTVEAIVRALRSQAADGELINVGANEPVTILELARLVQRAVGIEPPLRLKFISYDSFPGSYEDVRARVPDLRKAQALLGFEAHVPLIDGLRYTVEWHRGQRTAAKRTIAPARRLLHAARSRL
jgi:nucleoside-diphosphate-sugar epimerase